MKLNMNRGKVYDAVYECLTQIVRDFESGRIRRTYFIEIPPMRLEPESGMQYSARLRFFKPLRQQITRPKVVYDRIIADGLDGPEIVAESFTNDLIKKIEEEQI